MIEEIYGWITSDWRICVPIVIGMIFVIVYGWKILCLMEEREIKSNNNKSLKGEKKK